MQRSGPLSNWDGLPPSELKSQGFLDTKGVADTSHRGTITSPGYRHLGVEDVSHHVVEGVADGTGEWPNLWVFDQARTNWI